MSVLVFAALGCGGEESVLEVGVIEYLGREGEIAGLDAAFEVGMPRRVVVETFGGGCVTQGSIEVVEEEEVTYLTPFDRRFIPPDDGGCISVLFTYRHEIELSFHEVGTRHVVVKGRGVDEVGEFLVEREYSLEVQ